MDRSADGADRAVLAAGYVVLLALGAAIGVWGAFLVPLRLFGGMEGLSDAIGFAGPLAAGYFGAVGLGVAPAAVFPGIGWIVSILVLGYSPGGDVVIPAKIGSDPGIGTVGSLYLISGLVGTLAAGVLASYSLRRLRHLSDSHGAIATAGSDNSKPPR